jgi:hypothetical protein
MLRENGKGNPGGGVSNCLSKLKMNLRKGDTMEIVTGIYDLAAVLVFFGIAVAPRAIGTYRALRRGDK